MAITTKPIITFSPTTTATTTSPLSTTNLLTPKTPTTMLRKRTRDELLNSVPDSSPPSKTKAKASTAQTARKCLIFTDNQEDNIDTQAQKQQDLPSVNNEKSFTCQMYITRDHSCQITLTDQSSKLSTNSRSAAISSILGSLSELRVADFAPKGCLSLYQRNNRFYSHIVRLKIDGEDESSRIMLAYLKGLLSRKEELAVVPIPDSKKQLLIFDWELEQQQQMNNSSDNSAAELLNLSSFSVTLHAVLVDRYNLVLDLDETLIRTRRPKSAEEQPRKASAEDSSEEHEFYVEGLRYICCVRPGTNLLLAWGAQVFNVMIVTNSIWEYAKQILQILDPNREHLLKGINIDNNKELEAILKSRKDMVPHPNIPAPLGQKDLTKYNLSPFESIVLDDDETIWKVREPLLPFDKIVENKDSKSFFCAVRMESWKKLLHLTTLKNRLRDNVEKERALAAKQREAGERPTKRLKLETPPTPITFSQNHCLTAIQPAEK